MVPLDIWWTKYTESENAKLRSQKQVFCFSTLRTLWTKSHHVPDRPHVLFWLILPIILIAVSQLFWSLCYKLPSPKKWELAANSVLNDFLLSLAVSDLSGENAEFIFPSFLSRIPFTGRMLIIVKEVRSSLMWFLAHVISELLLKKVLRRVCLV